jgi:hypothetical protein
MNTTLSHPNVRIGPVISTWIVLDSPEDETEFPSAGTRSSTRSFQWIYWRCIVVFFASSIKQNPAAHHVLFCNRPFDKIEEQDTLALLRQWNIELIHIPITYRMPRGSVSKFGNVFYELDILKFAAEQDWPGIILTDNDCVWVKSAEPIAALLEKEPILGYTLQPEDQKAYQGDVLINGMSRKKMRALIQDVGGLALDRDVHFYGGEFLAASKSGCQTLVSYFDRLWSKTVQESREVDSIKTEEHFLTILYEAEKARPHAANPFIRRLWTHFQDFNVKPSDLDLSIWHVPAEKQFGFKSLYAEIVRAPEQFWSLSSESAVMLIRLHLGIPRRSSSKYVQDITRKIVGKIQLRILPRTTRVLSRPVAPPAGGIIPPS